MRVSRCSFGLARKILRLSPVSTRFYTNDTPIDGEKTEPTKITDLKTEQSTDAPESTLSFAEAFAKQAAIKLDDEQVSLQEQEKTSKEEQVDFATLLRKSAHVHLGAAKGQIVVGKVFHVVEDDLYIDFGGKFHCVCKRPEENAEHYHRGSRVRLKLKDTEVVDHFIGAEKDFSILEADAEILGLLDKKQTAQHAR